MMEFEGGKIKRESPRVLTPTKLDDSNLQDKNIKRITEPEKTPLEKIIDEALQKRDDLITGLLDLDNKYDALSNLVQDQIKDMNIPATNRVVKEAVRAFGGNNAITNDIYNKAKKTAQAIGTILGLNPLHVPFAKPTPNGKALTQYTGDILKECADIDWENFPNKKVYKSLDQKTIPFVPSANNACNLSNDGIGSAGKNKDGSVLTTLQNLMNKTKMDILNFLQYKLFWDLIYHKFLKIIILFHPKILSAILQKWTDKPIIGKFVKPLYCWLSNAINWFEDIPISLGLRPPPVTGDDNVTKYLK